MQPDADFLYLQMISGQNRISLGEVDGKRWDVPVFTLHVQHIALGWEDCGSGGGDYISCGPSGFYHRREAHKGTSDLPTAN